MYSIKNSSVSLINVTISPYKRPIHPTFQGGLPWSIRQDHAVMRHHRNGQPVCRPEVDFRAPAYLHDDYIYGGPLMLAFGHFIAESMHRIGPMLNEGDKRNILFSGPQMPRQPSHVSLPGHAIELLNFIGVKAENVQVASTPICVDGLHVGAQGCDLGGGPKEWYLDWLDGFTKNRLALLGTAPSANKVIYVSRSNYLEGGFLGEHFFEQRLAESGVFIFRPENYSVTSQIRTYIDADLILIGEGSACHGTEFIGRNLRNVGFFNRRPSKKSKIFKATLAPRSLAFSAFDGNIFLGAIPLSIGPMPEHQGITLLNWAGMVDLIDRLGMPGVISKYDTEDYLIFAKADLHRYIQLRKSKNEQNSYASVQEIYAKKLLVDFDAAADYIRNK